MIEGFGLFKFKLKFRKAALSIIRLISMTTALLLVLSVQFVAVFNEYALRLGKKTEICMKSRFERLS